MLIFSIIAGRVIPALLTKPWMSPVRAARASTVSCAKCGSATLPTKGKILSGAPSARLFKPSELRSTAATRAQSDRQFGGGAADSLRRPVMMIVLPSSETTSCIRASHRFARRFE